ncbi:MAG: phosphotransferase [Candidatus Neomarinimicrobiota bacterium]
MKITRLTRYKVSTNEAVLITKSCYGINGTAIELNGERDRNFLIINPNGNKFILKISNPADSEEIIDFQNKLLFHLASKNGQWKWQKPQVGLNGEFICDYETLDGNQLKVRLLTFLDGILLADFSPHDFSLMHDLGDFIGHISQSLSGFIHPAMHRKLFWDLKNGVELVKTHLKDINDNKRIDKISSLIDKIESTEALSSNQLRERVIYNDANHHNVLLQCNKVGKSKIVGAIDFGDSVFSWLVADLAIACTYSMLNKDIPLEYARPIVKGFNKTQPLNELEISSLFSLICLRTCMSVTIAAHQKSLYPNNPYLLISEKPAWNLIDKLIKISSDFAHFSFRHACGLEPSTSNTLY